MLNELANEIHKTAVEHGWWNPAPSFGEVVALCHSELSEALEEHRADRPMVYADQIVEASELDDGLEMQRTTDLRQFSPDDKPEGIAVEMADCLIRILDWAAHEGVDMDAVVRAKMDYNKTRPYRHGGKRL